MGIKQAVIDTLPTNTDDLEVIDYINMVEAHDYDLEQVKAKLVMLLEQDDGLEEYYKRQQNILTEHLERLKG